MKTLFQGLLAKGIPLSPISAQGQLSMADSQICEVLYPPADLQCSTADDQCLVLLWSTPSWRILYTADAGLPAERWLLEHAHNRLQADVWIRGSHARELTGSDDFVRAVHPRVVVVAGSRFRKQGEPLAEWARKWTAEGVTVWRQEECGAVQGWCGKTNRLRCFLSGNEISWPATLSD